MTARTLARTIGIAAVLWGAALFPQEAATQCAVSYSSTWVNDENGNDVVYAEASVGDYYGSSPCGSFYEGFYHGYSILIQMTCGVQYQEATAEEAAPGGGGSAWADTSLATTESLECEIDIAMVIYCTALPGTILEEYVEEQRSVNSCSLTAKFSGGLTSGNNLSYSVGDPAVYGGNCLADSLGVVDCSTHWLGKTEISGSVSDDASLWTTKQSWSGRVKRILGANPETDQTLNVPNDDPASGVVQKTSGQTKVFWLDAPGHSKSIGGQTVTSLYQIQNFTSRLEKGTFSCSLDWHLKLVVAGGSLLDSDLGLGHLSTQF